MLTARWRVDPWVAAGLVLALVGRVVVVLATSHYQPLFDAGDYLRHGVALAIYHRYPVSWLDPNFGPTAFRPPLYPFMLAGLILTFGPAQVVLVGRLTEAVLGTATVAVIGAITWRLWGRRAGRSAILVAAVWPPLLFLHAALMTEALFALLEVLVVLAALVVRSRVAEARPGAWRWAALCGVCCGLAALTRSNGVLLALVAAVGVWVVKPRWSMRALAVPAVLLLATLLTLTPWMIRDAAAFHRFVPIDTQTGYGMAGYFNDTARLDSGYVGLWSSPQDTARYRPIFYTPRQNEAQMDEALRSSAMRYAAQHPGYIVEGAALNLLRMLGFAPNPRFATKFDNIEQGLSSGTSTLVTWTFFAGLLLSAAAVLVIRRRPADERGPAFIWVMPILMLVVAAWLIGLPRYRTPAYPFVAMLVGLALSEWPGVLRKRTPRLIPATTPPPRP